jgi:hypothetical protein
MRKGSGIAGATLLYSSRQGAPDLLAVMQSLVDDLRADQRRISGLRHNAGSLRLRADPWDMVLTLADGPLPLAAMGGLLRPPRPEDSPDFARVHLARSLHQHAHALGFLLRRRGAPPPDLDSAARALVREGQLCLLAVLHAAPATLLIWQPGGLVLTPAELRSAGPALLLAPREVAVPLSVPRPERLALARPQAPRLSPPSAANDAAPDPAPDSADSASPPGPGAAPETAQGAPAPGVFGTEGTVRALPGFERASDRVTLALRGGAMRFGAPARADSPPRARPRLVHRAAPMAVILMWVALLPDLVQRLLPGF